MHQDPETPYIVRLSVDLVGRIFIGRPVRRTSLAARFPEEYEDKSRIWGGLEVVEMRIFIGRQQTKPSSYPALIPHFFADIILLSWTFDIMPKNG